MCTKRRETIIAVVLTLLLVMMVTSVTKAQSTANISITTTVLSGLSIEAEQDLRLGDIVSGETKRVNLDGTGTGSQPGDEQAGIFRITTPGNFTISFTEVPTVMVGTGAGNAGELLPVSFFSAWSTNSTIPNQANVVSLSNGTPIVITNNGMQSTFVFLGAEVNPPATQALGVYETTITITATFGID